MMKKFETFLEDRKKYWENIARVLDKKDLKKIVYVYLAAEVDYIIFAYNTDWTPSELKAVYERAEEELIEDKTQKENKKAI